MKYSLAIVAALLAASCVMDDDDPTNVRDLRVLAMQFEPPEVLITGCNVATLQRFIATDGGAGGGVDPTEFFEVFGALRLRTLIVDGTVPQGRVLDYTLSVCTDVSDRTCSKADHVVRLAEGQFDTGLGDTLSLTVTPLTQGRMVRTVSAGTPVLQDVIANDQFRGLGGIRVPVVLELTAPDTGEKIYAQKLMPYVCRFFPSMKQNVQPVLPGVSLRGEPWELDAGIVSFSGTDGIEMNTYPFEGFQEDYVVPTFSLQPVQVTESWKIAHYATMGTIAPYETGGTQLDGQTTRQRFTWSPDPKVREPREVTFYLVTRDGRGGESWLKRQAAWSP